MEPIKINPNFLNEEFKAQFLSLFRSGSSAEFNIGDSTRIIQKPFCCAVLNNFLSNSKEIICNLETESRLLPLIPRHNDLYSLNQSDDLKSLDYQKNGKFPLLQKLRQFFATDLLLWIQDVTGITLDLGEVDSTISLYKPNDFLLCHDDELDRRRIAFILYLVPDDWDAKLEGGSLDLIECNPNLDVDYHPSRICLSLPPQRNSLAFFEVCPRSFHQVQEIIGSRDRLSVHGWFKSDPLPRQKRSHDPIKIPRISACFIEEDLVYKWINPFFLDMQNQKAICRRFVSTSEIRLPHFLVEAEWIKLSKAMMGLNSSKWIHEGPMDLRNINVLPYAGALENMDEIESDLPDECRQVRRLLRSEAMLVILSELTGVTFHPLASPSPNVDTEESDSKRRRCEPDDKQITDESVLTELTSPRFHRWKPGMYTLLADSNSSVLSLSDNTNETAPEQWRLDLFYHITGYGTEIDKSTTDSNSTENVFGQVIYTSRRDNTELLRVNPEDNSLTLVYCNSDSAKFVHYITQSTKATHNASTDCNGTDYAFDVTVAYFDPNKNDDDELDSESNSLTHDEEDDESDEVGDNEEEDDESDEVGDDEEEDDELDEVGDDEENGGEDKNQKNADVKQIEN